MKTLYVLIAALLLSACATPAPAPPAPESRPDAGILWVKYSAEYQAISAQVYADARDDLPRLLANPDWSALPGQTEVAGKPPAIILDVDETVVSNVDFQLTLKDDYTSVKHYLWSRDYPSIPIRGVAETIAVARDLGIEVFFLTNRPCETIEGETDPCPQLASTIGDIEDIGIATDAEHVLLAWQQPGWSKEKLIRREFIGETHRVIALFGDDYGDFVHCTRAKPLEPCTEPATRDSRHAALDTYADYWGNGWYILPNPMHGSWTTVR
jgi:acid phosphatase